MYYAHFQLDKEEERKETDQEKRAVELKKECDSEEKTEKNTPCWGKQVSHGGENASQENATVIIHHILDCVENVSRFKYFGITVTMDILKGENSPKIKKYQLFQIPQFGILKNIDRKKLWIIVDWMIEKEYLLQTRGQYPVLHPTYNGRHFSETVTEEQMKELERRLKK